MSEAGDYVPAPHWQGVNDNFASARAAYDSVRQRSYDDAVANDIDVDDCVPESISTDSESPLIIGLDFSGSMGTWASVIVSKFPYLEYEAQEYLGDGMEISFFGIGDGPKGDKYPLQVRPFVKGRDLKEQSEKLIDEQGGGSNSVESYDLAAVYYLHNCDMPKAIRKPIMIFIGDEGVYADIYADYAKKWARCNEAKLNPETVFKKLCEKYSVYIIRKPYCCSGDTRSSSDLAIEKRWADLIGQNRIANLPAAERVVDVIFGILARETGRIDYFEDELKDRQLKDDGGEAKVAMVMKSLMTIHALPKESLKKIDGPKGSKSKSVTPSKATSKKGSASKSISLMD